MHGHLSFNRNRWAMFHADGERDGFGVWSGCLAVLGVVFEWSV